MWQFLMKSDEEAEVGGGGQPQAPSVDYHDESVSLNDEEDEDMGLGDEAQLFQLIDSDDIVMRFYSAGPRLKSRIVECFLKEDHMKRLFDILVSLDEVFLRDQEAKNRSHYGDSYVPDTNDLQYVFDAFDDLDCYFDNVIRKRPEPLYDQPYHQEDYDIKHIRNSVAKWRQQSLENGVLGLSLSSQPKSQSEASSAEEAVLGSTEEKQTSEEVSKSPEISAADETPPSDEKIIRRCNIIAEIYLSDRDSVMDTLLARPHHLLKLWSVLRKPRLHRLGGLVALFVKINETLLVKRTERFLNLVRTHIPLVELFVKKNVDVALLNEFLIKLIITDRANRPTGVLDTLADQGFIPLVLSLVDLQYPFYVRDFAGDLLKNLISLLTNLQDSDDDGLVVGPNALTRALVDYRNIWKMAVRMRQGGKTLFILVELIIELIRKNNDDYDKDSILMFADVVPGSADHKRLLNTHPPSDRDPVYLDNILRVFSLNLPWIASCLEDSEDDGEIGGETVNGEGLIFEEPGPGLRPHPEGYVEALGFDRLRLVELVAELLHCSNIRLYNNRHAQRLIDERNSLVLLKSQFLDEAIHDELVLDAEPPKEMSRPPTPVLEDVDPPSPQKESEESEDSGLSRKARKERMISTLALTIDTGVHSENKSVESAALSPEPEDSDSIMAEALEPFVSEKTEKKLLERATLGDVFKASLRRSNILDLVFRRLFLRFPWNNFWHNVVFDLVQQLLGGKMSGNYNPFLVCDMFGKLRMVDVVLAAQRRSAVFRKARGFDLGYTGHVALIAEEMHKFTQEYNVLMVASIIYDAIKKPEWEAFVGLSLLDTKRSFNMVLSGGKPEEPQYYRDPHLIILGNLEEEIQAQDLERSNPDKLKDLDDEDDLDLDTETYEIDEDINDSDEEDGAVRVVHDDDVEDNGSETNETKN